MVDRIAHLKSLYVSKKKQKPGTLTFIQGYPKFKFSVSIGKVISKHFVFDRYHTGYLVYTTNYVNFGNSGSPVVDIDGRVLGTVSMKTITNEGLYVPIESYIHLFN